MTHWMRLTGFSYKKAIIVRILVRVYEISYKTVQYVSKCYTEVNRY